MSELAINPVIIFGAGSLGKVALDILKRNGVVVYGFLDDDPSLQGQEIDFIRILGNTDDETFLKLIGHQCDAMIASDENKYRESLVRMLTEERKVMPVNAVHPEASLAVSANIGYGNLIGAGVKIGPDVQIGNHCLLHTGAIVEYECQIGDFVQIGAGSIVNGRIEIGTGAFIGSGATLVSGIKIGSYARVGAGSVVIENVKDRATVFGNPAQVMKS